MTQGSDDAQPAPKMVSTVGAAVFNPVFRRTIAGDGGNTEITYELPPWSAWIFLADLVVIVPLYFFVRCSPPC